MFTSCLDFDGYGEDCQDSIIEYIEMCSSQIKLISHEPKSQWLWCAVEACVDIDTKSKIDMSNFSKSKLRNEVDFQAVAVLVTRSSIGYKIEIIRTLNSTVPVYIVRHGNRAAVSWNFTLCSELSSKKINKKSCQKLIYWGPNLESNTIFQDVYLINGGQYASFGKDGCAIEQSSSLARYEPAALAEGAEAALYFLDLIASVVRPHIRTSAAPVLELSGGLDSSCIGAALRRGNVMSGTLPTYGLIQPGVAGIQQQTRRRELINIFDFHDVSVDSTECKPFSIFKKSIIRRVPSDEIYRTGIELCLSKCDFHPDVVVTGIGGDELTMISNEHTVMFQQSDLDDLFGESVEEVALTRHVASNSAIVSAFCRSDMFLSQHIWPINPFTHPHIVNFSQCLPSEIKKNRLLNKLALAKSGLSDYFLFPRYRENFSRVYDSDLLLFDVSDFFETSILHDYGIINCEKLNYQYRLFINEGKCSVPLTCFANAVRLEFFLRQCNL
ncbi:hypothetical protein [Methylobacterium sp. JK268]